MNTPADDKRLAMLPANPGARNPTAAAAGTPRDAFDPPGSAAAAPGRATSPRERLRGLADHASPHLARARAAWLARAPRERRALLLCALVVGATAGWLGGWEPAANAIASLERDLPRQREQAVQMQALGAQAATLRALPDPPAHRPAEWKAALAASLMQHGIAGASVEPGDDTLRVQVPRASFHAWMQWLEAVRREYGIKPVQLEAKALPGAQAGQVALNAELAPPGKGDR
ncbi:type II secretion system protein M [Cupriavidus basilensis]|uniref:Type II secretion system protein M n=1 Tax=Cupriavidus basilensis TaxID=68895 RepID=A0ABT6B2C4_9BURK|nr:type II secretion system protein M [Cupriavidus basilensis]MDF3839042.1 type II secretion system protein M [Cupriavidus basilensis]